MDGRPLGSSFRDPGGFVYTRDGVLYRQVNRVFQDRFEAFLGSGLYDELARQRLLVSHRPVSLELAASPEAVAVLEPERVPFVSYPYEWSVGQLRDAALLTLELQERALVRGFTLRDASAYNVQFLGGRPVLIDSLSFEPREEGAPWAAYGQFCQHFLVPLALMCHVDIRLGTLQRTYLDGVPLELGSRLLGAAGWLRPGLLFHVRAQAKLQRRYADRDIGRAARARSVGAPALLQLVRGLRGAVEGLAWNPVGTEWADYAHETNYTPSAAGAKRNLVIEMLQGLGARTVWDLGANTGDYSRAARTLVPGVVAFDLDPAAVERNYRRVRAEGETGILPLLMDLTNPSPAQGWAHRERLSLEERGPADVVLALALIHHLAIGHNLPLNRIADFLARLGRRLVIEFVAKSDSQVGRLLRNRPDIFPDYTVDGFESAFRRRFAIDRREPIPGSERTLYLMTALPGGAGR
ncbi:MAG TPA: class I SAM-dependent methyltransferase [Gemmatimonadales bacterium]